MLLRLSLREVAARCVRLAWLGGGAGAGGASREGGDRWQRGTGLRV